MENQQDLTREVIQSLGIKVANLSIDIANLEVRLNHALRENQRLEGELQFARAKGGGSEPVDGLPAA